MTAQALDATKDAVGAVPVKFEIGGKKAAFVLWICSFLFMVNWMDRQVFAVAAAPMMKALGMTKTEVGWINNFFLLSIAFLGIPVSYLINRWSRRKMICLMGLIWSMGTFLTGLGTGFFTILVSMMIVGFGEAGFGPGGTAIIGASYPPEQRGHKLGIFNMFIAIGIMVGLLAGGFCTQNWGWRSPFFIFAVPGITLSLIALTMQDYPNRPRAETGENFWQSFVAIWKTPTLVWLYLGWGMFMAMVMGNLYWMVALLIIAGFLLISLFSYPLGGWLADKWEARSPGGRMRYAAICSTAAGICVILFTTTLRSSYTPVALNGPLRWLLDFSS